MTFAIPLTNKLQSLTKSCHLYSSLITCNFCRRECSLVPVLKEIKKIIGLPPYDLWEHLLPVSECYRTMFSIDCDLYLQCSSGFPTTFFLHKKYDPEKKFVYFLLDHVWAQQHDADIGLAWNELCYFEWLQWSFMFRCSDLRWYMYLTHNESKSRRQRKWWLSVRLWSPLPFSLQHLSLGKHSVYQGVILISSHCVRNISKERMFTIKRWLW